MFQGDFAAGATVAIWFNTHNASGAPITLAGTPAVSVYKRGSTTESTAGVTLTVDYDSKTGLHVALIDTSADGTFYAAGSDFGVVLTAGTVDSVSVVGSVVGSFSLANRPVQSLASAANTAIRTEMESAGNTLATLLSRLTGTRAGYLDKLNITGNVASSAEVTSIQNNTRTVITTPEVIERPDTDTMSYIVRLYLYDEVGNMEAPDSTPTVTLVNQGGTDLSARLSVASNPSTGVYQWTYTASVGDALDQLRWEFSVVEGGLTRLFGRQSLIVDTTAVDFTSADRVKLNALHDDRLTAQRAANLDNLDATVSSRSTLTAAQVWANATRTLSSFGTLVSDTTTAVWAAIPANLSNMATRFLTMIESYSGGTLWRFLTGALSQAPSGGGGDNSVRLLATPLRSGRSGVVRYIRGTEGVDLRDWVLDANGGRLDLTGYTITASLLEAADETAVFSNQSASLGAAPDEGQVELAWPANSLDTPGQYKLIWTATSGSTVITWITQVVVE